MDATETTDLELSAIWEAMESAGATVYEWCEDGVTTGVQAIRIGRHHWLTVSDSEGYEITAAKDVPEDDLIPADEVDDEAALRENSDLSGYFGVVGIPGSVHHDFEWFEAEDEASGWLDRTMDATLRDNPVLGTIEGDILPAKEAFEITYRDGSRVYFRPKQVGRGFEPRIS
jgi:hypothetical protein